LQNATAALLFSIFLLYLRKQKQKEGSMSRKAAKENKSVLSPEKAKAVEAAVAQIEKNHGKGAIMTLGKETAEEIPVISTGCIQLDMALGVGGIPRGRIIEIFGPESSGKTTLTLHCIAEAQKAGGVAAFIDAEHAFDANYARKLGVDIDSLLVSQPDSGEQALDICETLVRSSAFDLIVIDSVAALVPEAEIKGEMGDSHMGLQARLMSQALRKLTGILNKSNTALIFINQIRMKIGVMFGNPETTTGGNALKFYASQRMDIRRVSTIKEGENSIGNRTRVKVVKNKVAPPFTQCEFDILYGQGISKEASILDLAVDLEFIQKSGSWFSYNGERIGQGRPNALQYLKENLEVSKEIEKKIREHRKEIEMFRSSSEDSEVEN
jgi:recombination protein RecA